MHLTNPSGEFVRLNPIGPTNTLFNLPGAKPREGTASAPTVPQPRQGVKEEGRSPGARRAGGLSPGRTHVGGMLLPALSERRRRELAGDAAGGARGRPTARRLPDGAPRARADRGQDIPLPEPGIVEGLVVDDLARLGAAMQRRLARDEIPQVRLDEALGHLVYLVQRHALAFGEP